MFVGLGIPCPDDLLELLFDLRGSIRVRLPSTALTLDTRDDFRPERVLIMEV